VVTYLRSRSAAPGGRGGSVLEDENRLSQVERRKLYFEAYKHMTTLNTASALILLAIYREASSLIPSVEFLFPMAGIGISLALSLVGMYDTAAKEDIEDRGKRARLVGHRGLEWSLLTFCLGVILALGVEAINSIMILIGHLQGSPLVDGDQILRQDLVDDVHGRHGLFLFVLALLPNLGNH
jgi:hypothetical protein